MKYEITSDGNAIPARELGDLTSIKWTEVDMQYVVGLNPKLIGVSDDDLAVGRDGGGTERMSDMLYVDEMGRATIVELKNENASLKDLAQLLGYADHERHLPTGETERRHLCAEHGWNGDWHSRAVKHVKCLARTGRNAGREHGIIPLHEPSRETLQTKAEEKWGERSLSLRGSPARSILISKDCTSCEGFTRLLQAHQVNLRLVDADLLRSTDGRLVLDWRPREIPPEIDLMWEATRYLWQDDFIREKFEPNGWAEHRYRGYVSFSARASGRVRFYLSRDDGGRVLISGDLRSGNADKLAETWIPDKWCSTSERRRLNRALQESLADVPPQRSFSLPKERVKFTLTASALSRVILKVLTPDR